MNDIEKRTSDNKRLAGREPLPPGIDKKMSHEAQQIHKHPEVVEITKTEARLPVKLQKRKEYNSYLLEKRQFKTSTTGFETDHINSMLYDFQRDIVKWALSIGRAAIFADCGLGKTPIQLVWAYEVCRYTGGNVLILAPLAVSQQTVREGKKFNVKVKYCRSQKEIEPGVNITNYEMMDSFDNNYAGVVLDESSIIKSYTGVFRNKILKKYENTDFRLACTATPAPNDYMELGNHSEFLGIAKRQVMLSTYFVHDGETTQQWRLKGHAKESFWKWICSWAVMLRKPSDLGYDDDNKFLLPKLNIHEVIVPVDMTKSTGDMLFRMPSETLQGRQKERKITIDRRANACAEIINGSSEPWLIWCNLNEESAKLSKAIDGCIEIKGSDKREHKENAMLGFSDGRIKRIVTKPKIAGFGMNWQHCANIAFVGLSDSYEQYYQAIRRCWRFGQKKEVNCYIITAQTEGVVVENIKRKEKNANELSNEMVKHMQVYNKDNIRGTKKGTTKHKRQTVEENGWQASLGDCIEEISEIKSDSIHYSIFSPPFADLYTYGDSIHDLGNNESDGEFFRHFDFLIKQLSRVMIPGRLVSIHCMNLPTTKTHWGYIGLRDFRGDIIRAFEKNDFIYHSEVCIWKCPVTAVSRTKALGLLHKQMVKDSAMSRNGIPDYLVTMRKPGDNPEHIKGTLDRFVGDASSFERRGKLSIDIWQKYASPIWTDINQSRTLQKTSARAHKDEKHICPLQLDVIERSLQLWTNDNDLVLSPFMGIGSEGFVAIKMGRRFIGIELKESYFKQAVKNLRRATRECSDECLYSEKDLKGSDGQR